MTRPKIKKEQRTPMYLHLPTQLKQEVATVADQQKRKEREVVVSALTMYLAYVAAQPATVAAPAAQTTEGN